MVIVRMILCKFLRNILCHSHGDEIFHNLPLLPLQMVMRLDEFCKENEMIIEG